MDPEQTPPVSNNKSTPYIIGAVVIILIIGAIIVLQKNNDNTNTESTQTTTNQQDTMTQDETMTNTETNSNMDSMTNSNTNTGDTMQGEVKTFTVSGSNFKFSPTQITVKKGDTVRITFNNQSGTHDLVVDGYNVATKIINSGQSETVEFVADKTGTFEYYCSVGTHRQMGMKGTLTVQ